MPEGEARRYLAEGSWTDATLGATVAEGLGRLGAEAFQVHSQVRPWVGTFADVDRAALAGALAARGIGPGSVVVLQLPNWVEAAISFWAAAYVGAVVIPIVHSTAPRRWSTSCGRHRPTWWSAPAASATTTTWRCTPTCCGSTPSPSGWWPPTGAPSGSFPRGATPVRVDAHGGPGRRSTAADPDAPAIVGFTSGTTRDPKGVVHSHRTIGFEARQLDYMFPKGGPPGITGAPVGHFIGMLNAFLVPLLRERPVHLVDVWDPGEVLRLMSEEGLGVGGGATYFLTSLLDHPDFSPAHLAQMPFAGLGGSPVPVAVMERATKLGIRVFRSYGSTEHPSITGCLLSDPEVKRLTTDGRVLPGVELKLSGDGEILSRGPDCFLGYTDATLTARVFDAEGWYHTGDVGTLDDDGFLTITDRTSDIIIRGGENISAQEIEELMVGMDGVAEVCVVAEPDARLGEHAAAVVRVHDGAAPPTLDQVRRHLATAGLARQKWPESIIAVREFPRTASGKVQKFRLRQQLREGRPGTAGGENAILEKQ